MEKVSFADFIIWTSPAAFALALYLAHDAFTSVKEEIKSLRDRQNNLRDEIVEMKSQLGNVGEIARSTKIVVDSNSSAIQKIESRSESLDGFIKNIDRKIIEHDENYGKVILILKKVIERLQNKNPQKPQE